MYEKTSSGSEGKQQHFAKFESPSLLEPRSFQKNKKQILVKIKLKKKGAKSPTLVVHESDGNVEI